MSLIFRSAAVTGHRPEGFTTEQYRWVSKTLPEVATRLRDEFATTVCISGMARGADLLWAQAGVDVGMGLHAYIPFEDQTGSRDWTDEEKAQWARLRSIAVSEKVFNPGPGYHKSGFFRRNDGMVKDSALVIAVWRPSVRRGGTFYTYEKACDAQKPLLLVDADRMRVQRVNF